MDSGDISDTFRCGYWKWNKNKKTTTFVNKYSQSSEKLLKGKKYASSTVLVGVNKSEGSKINFRDIDLINKATFCKLFQRKLRLHDAPIVILQDIKDIVLYSISAADLTLEMIEYLHMPVVDRFFRALIVYFQFYIQVWKRLMVRRREFRRHVWHPQVIKVESQIRDDLADLRSMVSREYVALILGLQEAKKFHHMPDKSYPQSCGRQDVRLNELLVQVSVQIVWVALRRPNISLIEMELYRLARTNYFNKFINERARRANLTITLKESRILRGTGDVYQKRLVAQTALAKEVLYGRHDPRMLALGQKTFPVNDSRIRYLEIAYTAPEHKLQEYGVKVGILGMPKSEFDVMLKLKRMRPSDASDVQEEAEWKFKMPACDPNSAETLPQNYPTQPPNFHISAAQQKVINHQYNMWKEYTRLLDNSRSEQQKKAKR